MIAQNIDLYSPFFAGAIRRPGPQKTGPQPRTGTDNPAKHKKANAALPHEPRAAAAISFAFALSISRSS